MKWFTLPKAIRDNVTDKGTTDTTLKGWVRVSETSVDDREPENEFFPHYLAQSYAFNYNLVLLLLLLTDE